MLAGLSELRQLHRLLNGYCSPHAGLYCTGCLAKLQDVPQAQLATLEDLSRLIADLTEAYRKSAKSGSNLLVLKAEAETQGKVAKGLRDALTIDVKSVFSKVSSLAGSAEGSCGNEYKNEPLEDFFEPSLTTSVLLNDSELFINNLHNLKVVCEGKKVAYEFKESQKNPEAAKAKALKQLDQSANALGLAQNKVRGIMGRFREAAKAG